MVVPLNPLSPAPELEPEIEALSDDALRAKTDEFRARLRDAQDQYLAGDVGETDVSGDAKAGLQHVAAMLYAGSALGAVFAGDMITLFVYWELTAIASVFLIWADPVHLPEGERAAQRERSYRAGLRYLIIQVLSGVILLAGVAATTWQMLRAESARDEALRQARRAATVNRVLIGILEAGDPNESGGSADLTVREALDRAMQGPRATRRWYLSVLDEMAAGGGVWTQSIQGLDWAEIDYPMDLIRTASMVDAWGRGGVDRHALGTLGSVWC